MNDLASPNKPPRIEKTRGIPKAIFPRDFDFRAQLKVVETWKRLNAEAEQAFPVLLRHLDDKRYSLTAQEGYSSDECDENYDVGHVCSGIISRHVWVWRYWVEEERRLEGDRWRGTWPDWFGWRAEVKKALKDRPPTLFALQVKGFEWAIREQRKRPARDEAQQAVALECLRGRRDELVRSGRPIPCSPWGIEEFDFHLPKELEAEEEKNWRKLEKAMRAEVARLASPNRPPKIEKGKVAHFPEGYDREAQERVVGAIRALNKNLFAALPALVDAGRDKRYCVTLEGPDGVQRNVTVGQLCCLMLAANVNVYRPYVRSLEGPGSYPMYLRPTAFSVARWWQDHQGNSLTQIQHAAFGWALGFEARRGGFRDERERDVRLAYLRRRADEYWGCHVPIVVDLLKGERVVLPKGSR